MIALVLLACRPDGARLEGLWVNEETEIRALSFEPLDTPEPNGTRLAYDLYLYRPSQDPRVVQSVQTPPQPLHIRSSGLVHEPLSPAIPGRRCDSQPQNSPAESAEGTIPSAVTHPF